MRQYVKRKWKAFRSSINGRFVTKREAERAPDVTTRETLVELEDDGA